MESPDKASVPTDQYFQTRKTIEEQVGFETVEDSEDMFVIAKERMVHINDWNKHTQSADVSFQLLDANGHKINRHVHSGDFIQINSTRVKIESIVYDDFPDDNRESIGVKLVESGEVELNFCYFFLIERIYTDVFARFESRCTSQELEDDAILSKLPDQVIQEILKEWLDVDGI